MDQHIRKAEYDNVICWKIVSERSYIWFQGIWTMSWTCDLCSLGQSETEAGRRGDPGGLPFSEPTPGWRWTCSRGPYPCKIKYLWAEIPPIFYTSFHNKADARWTCRGLLGTLHHPDCRPNPLQAKIIFFSKLLRVFLRNWKWRAEVTSVIVATSYLASGSLPKVGKKEKNYCASD